MKVKKIIIENFKCFDNSSIELGNLTSLIGENSAGKSSVLQTLEMVLTNKHPTSRDFKNVVLPITITVFLTGLAHPQWKECFNFFDTNALTLKCQWEPAEPGKKISTVISKQPSEEILRPWTSGLSKRKIYRSMKKNEGEGNVKD